MATATYAVATGSSTLSGVWRKIQVGILTAFNYDVEEWGWLKRLKPLDVNWSSREITAELDINQPYGAAAISEGGKEARPSSPNTVTATITWAQYSKRLTISKTSKFIQQQQGGRGQLVSQLKWQAKSAVRALQQKLGIHFWGFSTGVVALQNGAISTDTVTLDAMHGVAGLGSLSHNWRCADLFIAGDYIAVLNPSGPALRTAGIVLIDSVDRTLNTITGSAFSDVTTFTDNDFIVFANDVENTTLAGGTEYNKEIVGILDGLTSTSVHSVSGATYPNWTSQAVSTSGRFDGVKLRKMKQAIRNRGGGEMDTLIWANGVENDVTAQLQASMRFDMPFSLEMDGQPVTKGVKILTSKRTPDGYVCGYDSANSVGKMVLLPDPSEGPAWDDLDKLQDDSGYVGGIDYLGQMVWQNRANTAYASNQTQV